MSEKKRTALLLGFVFLSLAVIWAIMLPKGLSNRKAEAFAQPFFSHAAPQGAEVLQQTATRQKEDGAYVTMATQILEFSQAPQQAQLEEFYSDVEYPPAEEGQGVTLAAKELDSASISALQQAGLYEEGKHYWFVYLGQPKRLIITNLNK